MSAEYSSEDHVNVSEWLDDISVEIDVDTRDSWTRLISRSANDTDPCPRHLGRLRPSDELSDHQMNLLNHRDNATALLSGGYFAWHNLDIPDPILKFISTVISGIAVTIGVKIIAWAGHLIQEASRRAMHKWRTKTTTKVSK